MEVVTECQLAGVSELYVSSITCRPSHKGKIDAINNLLLQNAYVYDYKFIDNSNVKEYGLASDKLHLNKDGTALLANNILNTVKAHYYRNA